MKTKRSNNTYHQAETNRQHIISDYTQICDVKQIKTIKHGVLSCKFILYFRKPDLEKSNLEIFLILYSAEKGASQYRKHC